ncbi:glycoside hydrolase family 28 protein [Pediococcus acidilactici]|uniref:glycoside hydrolase family 28 protein n=1 Tax=Pediococcus acidilactici TaxID=1254 RepID=UPI003A902CEA
MVVRIAKVDQYANGDEVCTRFIQSLIDKCDAYDTLILPKGVFKVGSLFLKSHLRLVIEKGTTLIGSENITDFKEIPTRVAGVEMQWPAAILNVIDAEDVTIEGHGTINGQGPIWWERYWGTDGKGGARAKYDAQNLRWIVDYEVKRPRNLLIYSSSSVQINDINLEKSGFWNLQVTYSKNVKVSGITVKNNDGPSTDGIDIDSSSYVLVENSTLSCGDDCIVIKSGRDGDGWRVGKSSSNIEIKNCRILSGYGVVIGSEISGGVKDVYIHDLVYENSSCGFRMKSSAARGGFVDNVVVERLSMHNVQFPFSWLLNWHPSYNHKEFDRPIEEMPQAWQAVAAQIPEEQQKSRVTNILVRDVRATLSAEYALPSRAFDISAYADRPMENVHFENVTIEAKEFGRVIAVKNMNFNKVNVSVEQANNNLNDEFDNR